MTGAKVRRNRLALAVRSVPRLGQLVQVTRRLTLLQTYTVVSALCVLGLVLGLGALITRHLTERMLVRDGQLTAEFVRAQVREHLGPADFAPGAAERFADAFREISKIPEILQANVFDKTGTIIWSSEPSLVGQRFPGKHDLREAFEGRVVTGVAKGKPEQIKGPGVPGRLVELYVPFSFGGGPVVGVLETYKAPILLDEIRRTIVVTWIFIVLGGGLLYASLLWLVRRVWVSYIESERNLAERNRDLTLVNSRLATLAHLNRGVLSSLEPGKVLDLVAESAVKLLPGVCCAHLWLLDEGTETLSLAAEAGEPAPRPDEQRLQLRDSLIGWIVTSGTTDGCLDVLQDPRWKNRDWARQERIVSHAGAPVRSEARLLGGLSVLSRQPHTFTDDELDLLTSLATSAAVAIENAQLFVEARRGRTEWQETFDAIDDPMILLNSRHEVLRVNRAAAASVTSGHLIGKLCCPVFCGRDEPDPHCPVAEVLRSARPASREMTTVNDGGRTVQIRAYPISGDGTGIHAVVEHRRDITEEKEAEARLLQVEKLRALGELAGGVAHDFNNALAVVVGRADLLAASLKGGRLDIEELGRGLEIIKRAGRDGAAMVRRIRHFTRFERAADLAPLGLNGVVREAVEFTRPRWAGEAQAQGIEIAVDARFDEVPPVQGDPTELREVFTNLILNAVGAMPGGGTMSFRSWFDGACVCVAVRDTGIGMSETVRRRVFDPFFTTKGPRGTGLGLSVAFGIVRRHGGEISVESAPGRGSTFTIRLPAAGEVVTAPGEPVQELVRPARILLIDDDGAVLDTLKAMLESAGHAVVTAPSGEAGLLALGKGEFDLVLSDLNMRGMSGWDVARDVREAKPTVPVVLITGWSEQITSERLRESGVTRTVGKPVEITALLDAVAEAVRGAGR